MSRPMSRGLNDDVWAGKRKTDLLPAVLNHHADPNFHRLGGPQDLDAGAPLLGPIANYGAPAKPRTRRGSAEEFEQELMEEVAELRKAVKDGEKRLRDEKDKQVALVASRDYYKNEASTLQEALRVERAATADVVHTVRDLTFEGAKQRTDKQIAARDFARLEDDKQVFISESRALKGQVLDYESEVARLADLLDVSERKQQYFQRQLQFIKGAQLSKNAGVYGGVCPFCGRGPPGQKGPPELVDFLSQFESGRWPRRDAQGRLVREDGTVVAVAEVGTQAPDDADETPEQLLAEMRALQTRLARHVGRHQAEHTAAEAALADALRRMDDMVNAAEDPIEPSIVHSHMPSLSMSPVRGQNAATDEELVALQGALDEAKHQSVESRAAEDDALRRLAEAQAEAALREAALIDEMKQLQAELEILRALVATREDQLHAANTSMDSILGLSAIPEASVAPSADVTARRLAASQMGMQLHDTTARKRRIADLRRQLAALKDTDDGRLQALGLTRQLLEELELLAQENEENELALLPLVNVTKKGDRSGYDHSEAGHHSFEITKAMKNAPHKRRGRHKADVNVMALPMMTLAIPVGFAWPGVLDPDEKERQNLLAGHAADEPAHPTPIGYFSKSNTSLNSTNNSSGSGGNTTAINTTRARTDSAAGVGSRGAPPPADTSVSTFL